MGRKARTKWEQREKRGLGPPPSARRRRRKWVTVALVALLLVGGGVGAWLWNGARATPPELAPRFNLLASTGKVITLDEYLGKQEVVLIFYMVST